MIQQYTIYKKFTSNSVTGGKKKEGKVITMGTLIK